MFRCWTQYFSGRLALKAQMHDVDAKPNSDAAWEQGGGGHAVFSRVELAWVDYADLKNRSAVLLGFACLAFATVSAQQGSPHLSIAAITAVMFLSC